LRSFFFLFFLSSSLVSVACDLSPVCYLSNKPPDALQINVFLVAKANRAERQNDFADLVQDLGKSAKCVRKRRAKIKPALSQGVLLVIAREMREN